MTTAAPVKRKTVVRELIEARGMKYRFVAGKLALSSSGTSLVLDGLRTMSARHLVALEELLGVEASVFFDGERLRYVDETREPEVKS